MTYKRTHFKALSLTLALLCTSCCISGHSGNRFTVEIPEVPIEIDDLNLDIEMPDDAFLEEIPFVGGEDLAEGLVFASGVKKSEVRELEPFDCLHFEAIGTGTVSHSNHHSITITADENVLPFIETKVQDRELWIGFADDSFNLRQLGTIDYQIGVENLNCVVNAGAGDMYISPIRTELLNIRLLGAGNINAKDIKAQNMSVVLDGMGSIGIDGDVEEQQIFLRGAGSYHAPKLTSQVASIDLSGVGDAVLQVSDALEVNISGIGNVTYSGNPVLTTSLSGIGSLIQN